MVDSLVLPLRTIDTDDFNYILTLLGAAKCPACDGGGTLVDDMGDPFQCQWCCERDSYINAYG